MKYDYHFDKNKIDVYDFMDTLIDNDLPDGAYCAVLEELVDEWNEYNNTNYDSNETMLEYFNYKNNREDL